MPKKESFKVKPNTEIKKNLPVRLTIGLHKKLKILTEKTQDESTKMSQYL